MMAMRSARVIGTAAALRGEQLYNLLSAYDPLLDAESALRSRFPAELNYPYISRRLELIGMRRRAVDLADALVDAGDPQALVMIAQGQQGQGELEEAEKNFRLALQADPGDQQARYALLQPRFEEVLNAETVPELYGMELRRLRGTGLVTLRGRYALSRGRLNELAELDAALASVLPSDLWYKLSVKLRAEWRIRLTSPELQPRMAEEAIRLIDSAIVFFPDQELHAMRLEAAVVAENVAATIETARRLIYIIGLELAGLDEGTSTVSDAFITSRLGHILRVERLIEDLAGHQQAPAYKLELLADSAEEMRRQLALLDSNN